MTTRDTVGAFEALGFAGTVVETDFRHLRLFRRWFVRAYSDWSC